MTVSITVFSDFASPYCYLTETALRRSAAGRDLAVRYRAYELLPAPAPLPSPSAAVEWPEAIDTLAAEEGITLHPPAFHPRTRKAHEAARFAAERGLEPELRDAIFAAFWRDGRDIARIDVLCELIVPLGVDPADLRIALDLDNYRDDVDLDRELAARLRIPGVPTIYLGTGPSARILLGAQSRPALDEAIAERL